jgi:hypothetical protein
MSNIFIRGAEIFFLSIKSGRISVFYDYHDLAIFHAPARFGPWNEIRM